MQAPTQDHHDWKAADYAARWVADATSRDDEREGQLALLAALIPRPRDAAIRVLDLGARLRHRLRRGAADIPGRPIR